MKSDRTAAENERTTHAFAPGVGYVRVGAPPMPARPIAAAAVCVPPAPAAANTEHMVQPPTGPAMQLTWSGSEWIPPLGKGKRMAFTPAYLAAHGWTYVGPAV